MIKNDIGYYEVVSQYYVFRYSDWCVTKRLSKLVEFLQQDVVNKITSCMPQLLRKTPYYDQTYIDKLQNLANDFKDRLDTLVVIGMGGAILNSICLHDFVLNRSNVKTIFLHTVSENEFIKLKNELNLAKTGFIFISNCGNTVETASLAERWCRTLRGQFISDFTRNLVFIYSTKNHSILKNLNQKYGGNFLEYDSSMGGRFSTFTTPHILIGMINGIDIQSFFAGANHVLESVLSGSHSSADAIISGAIMTAHNLSDFHSSNIICGSYDTRLNGLIKWYCGAMAETLGKNHIQLMPVYLDLPLDQHGLMQAILINKTNQKFNLFSIKSHKSINTLLEDEMCETLHQYNIPMRKIILKNDDIGNLGAIMMHMILELITAAMMLNIEPFDQPEIDAIKKNLVLKYKCMQ